MLKLDSFTVWGLTIAALLSLASPADAGMMLFSDRTAFNAAAGSLSGFESFESFVAQVSPVDFGPFTVSESGESGRTFFSDPATSRATDGSKSLAYNTETVDSLLTYSFDSPISAFGFDISSFNTSGSQTITVGGDVSATITLTSSSSPVFFGVIDDSGSFDTLTFSTSFFGGSTGVSMDAVAFSNASVSAVPEPSSFALLGTGLLVALGYGVRRRKSGSTEE